ncbi:hypothetical protein SUGI_0139040 [Cryptomeria japonica]|nr:hypothetical protein SUGI_0139040 [Cryptomeria japonica]
MSYIVQAPAFLDRRCFVGHVACIFPVGRMNGRWSSNAYYALGRRGISCRVINGSRNSVAGSSITSWLPIDPVPQSDDAAYGGWSHGGITIQTEKRKGYPFLIFIGGRKLLGISLAILLCLTFFKKGFKPHLNAPVAETYQFFKPLIARFTSVGPIKTFNSTSATEKAISSMLEDKNQREKDIEYDYSAANKVIPRNSENKDQRESISETTETEVSHVSEKKLWRMLIPAVIDSAQLEALSELQKLKIVESHVQPGDLCTRREYARWLVSANSVFARNPSDRVFPSAYVEGVTVLAFDDISQEDPDFPYIQGLAEAGVIYSKLSFNNLNFSNDDTKLCHAWTMFYPENHLSRVDLLSWKMFAEHKHLPEVHSTTLEKKPGFLDAKQIRIDSLSAVYMDTLAGNKSVIAKAFGYSRRFQPNKPVTKGQALIAIRSGKVAAMVSEELSRVEAENSAKEAVTKEILSEMVTREEIKTFWDKELGQAKQQRIEAEKILDSAVSELKREKAKVKSKMPKLISAEAILELQHQYQSKLMQEASEIQKSLLEEEQNIQIEEEELEKLNKESQAEIEALSAGNSLVEAEKKAIILSRLYVEDETRKIQAQSEILKEAVSRWKFTSSTCSCWCHQQDGTKEDVPEEGKSSHSVQGISVFKESVQNVGNQRKPLDELGRVPICWTLCTYCVESHVTET